MKNHTPAEESKENGPVIFGSIGAPALGKSSEDVSRQLGRTLDSCYLKAKAQIEEMERERQGQEPEVEKTKEELEAIEKIPGWVEAGKQYIDESKWGDWEKYVNCSARDMYHGMDIDDTLELLRMIDNGESWKDVKKAFAAQGHSSYSYSVVRNRVVYFSKRGFAADREFTSVVQY